MNSQDSRDDRKKGRGSSSIKTRKKKICRFCEDKELYIDYRDEKRLIRFITEQGKIIPKRTSGTCSKHQRQLAIAIKRARHLAMIPFVSDIPR